MGSGYSITNFRMRTFGAARTISEMARLKRVVVPGCWHHVTQRGNFQQTVFYDAAERRQYLQLLKFHCARHEVRIAGYCLMGNHVHLLLIPDGPDSLALAMGHTHTAYSRWINIVRCRVGHLWQNRYYSCVLDEDHQWEALRYAELNPLRAGLAVDPAHWQWSSANAHLTGWDPTGLLDFSDWRQRWSSAMWREALDCGIADAALAARIRDATRRGRPLGDDDFVTRIEQTTGRQIHLRKRGRPPKEMEAKLVIE
jgi:REP-associated tyrosine transposase